MDPGRPISQHLHSLFQKVHIDISVQIRQSLSKKVVSESGHGQHVVLHRKITSSDPLRIQPRCIEVVLTGLHARFFDNEIAVSLPTPIKNRSSVVVAPFQVTLCFKTILLRSPSVLTMLEIHVCFNKAIESLTDIARKRSRSISIPV